MIIQQFVFNRKFRAADFLRIAQKVSVIRRIVSVHKRHKTGLRLSYGRRRRRFRRLRTFPIHFALAVFLDQIRFGILRNVFLRRHARLLRRLINRHRQLVVLLLLLFGLDLRLHER